MQKANEHITYTFIELEEVLKEVEIVLQSLYRIGSFYGDKLSLNEELYQREYEKETTRFIDEWSVCDRLAKIRRILLEKFDNTLGEDDMDDVERAMEFIRHWTKPGDMP